MIKLVKMDDEQYQTHLQLTIDGYARELVQTGLWSAKAAKKKQSLRH